MHVLDGWHHTPFRAMTPEAQRIAIAEACGWKSPYHPENIAGMNGWWSQKRGVWWVNPLSERVMISSVPDYPNDLNAMHEAEKVLMHDQQVQFSIEVGRLTTAYLPASRSAWTDFTLMHATAAQRAEAFLRTLNLWKE